MMLSGTSEILDDRLLPADHETCCMGSTGIDEIANCFSLTMSSFPFSTARRVNSPRKSLSGTRANQRVILTPGRHTTVSRDPNMSSPVKNSAP